MPLITVCEYPDERDLKDAAWSALVAYAETVRTDIIVLPEMPFCEWIFVGTEVVRAAWETAIAEHDRMIPRLAELACRHVVTSRPIETAGHRYNEAFVWSADEGYVPLRRKWYLPDVPSARERVWFSHGDRNFTPVAAAGELQFGIQLCSEVMLTQHAQEIGLDGAHLIAHPRATGGGRRWKIASEMSAIASGCYVASANRRSSRSDMFSGGSWVLSPDAVIKCETTAETPFATANVDLVVATRAKSQYPFDLLRTYLVPGLGMHSNLLDAPA